VKGRGGGLGVRVHCDVGGGTLGGGQVSRYEDGHFENGGPGLGGGARAKCAFLAWNGCNQAGNERFTTGPRGCEG